MQLDVRESGRGEIGEHVLDPVPPRVEVEDELLLRVGGNLPEERLPIARVVDRAEAGGRLDGGGGSEVVQVGLVDLGARPDAPSRRVHHRPGHVDADVVESRGEQRLGEPRIAAGEIEHPVAALELRPERDHQLRAVPQVTHGVGVLLVGPALGRDVVLARPAHSPCAAPGRETPDPAAPSRPSASPTPWVGKPPATH